MNVLHDNTKLLPNWFFCMPTINIFVFNRGLQSQYSMYPTAAAAMSQIERERLGIPGHHVGLDPNDPMVNPKNEIS